MEDKYEFLNKYLLKSQQNRIYKWIKNSHLEPNSFDWSEIDVNRGTRLWYKGDANVYLDFKSSDFGKGYSIEFSPAASSVWAYHSVDSPDGIFLHLSEWLSSIKKEINEPDLWGDMLKYQTQLSVSAPESKTNETISYAEVEVIRDRATNFLEGIQEQFELTQEELKLLNEKVEVLVESAKSQKSQVWMHTAIGVFMTILMACPSIQANIEEYRKLIVQFFGTIIHLLK